LGMEGALKNEESIIPLERIIIIIKGYQFWYIGAYIFKRYYKAMYLLNLFNQVFAQSVRSWRKLLLETLLWLFIKEVSYNCIVVWSLSLQTNCSLSMISFRQLL
jgi:hypothetical protein